MGSLRSGGPDWPPSEGLRGLYAEKAVLPLGTTLGLEMWEYQYLGAHHMATWMDRQLSRSGGVDSGRWRGCPKPRIHRPPSPPEYQALPQSWQRITSPSGQPLPMVALGMRKHDPRLSPPGPICSGQRWLGVPIWWHSPWHTVWVPGLRLQRAWQLRNGFSPKFRPFGEFECCASQREEA